jgi:hypothetical protein
MSKQHDEQHRERGFKGDEVMVSLQSSSLSSERKQSAICSLNQVPVSRSYEVKLIEKLKCNLISHTGYGQSSCVGATEGMHSTERDA